MGVSGKQHDERGSNRLTTAPDLTALDTKFLRVRMGGGIGVTLFLASLGARDVKKHVQKNFIGVS